MLRLISVFLVAALCFPGALGAVGRQTPEPTKGSAELALNAALEAVRLSPDEVTHIRTEYEIDDGRAEYEVEFRDGNWEYEYTVDAETGAILEADKDYDPPEEVPPVVQDPIPEPPASQRLTAAEAKAIVLAHAGVAEADAKRLQAELDYDDGVAEWEIEFDFGRYEYEYEINADTGAILSFEKDD